MRTDLPKAPARPAWSLPGTDPWRAATELVALETLAPRAQEPPLPPRAGERDIEVEGSHLGMGWNPKVLRLVGERLARTPLASLPARVLRSGTGSHDHAVKHPC